MYQLILNPTYLHELFLVVINLHNSVGKVNLAELNLVRKSSALVQSYGIC